MAIVHVSFSATSCGAQEEQEEPTTPEFEVRDTPYFGDILLKKKFAAAIVNILACATQSWH